MDLVAPVQVLQVKYAERTAIKSRVFDKYDEHGLPDGELAMDYNYWIIKAPNAVILVDTGYDVSEGVWLGEQSVTPVPETLAKLDIDPAEVTMVILSHYHFDHIGYVRLFPNAEVVAGADEHDSWFAKFDAGTIGGEFVDARHLNEIRRVQQQGRLRLVPQGRTELAPGLVVHTVGGHCPGQLLVEVQSSSGPLILASDVAHFYEQIEFGWVFFVYSDIEEMRAAFRFLRDLSVKTGGAVIPGHDARVRDRYPALEGPGAAFANVLG